MFRRPALAALTLFALLTTGVITEPSAHADTSASVGAVRHPAPTADLHADAPLNVRPSRDSVAVVGIVDTRIHWTRRTSWLTYGGRSILEGQVAYAVASREYALSDAEVTLDARPSGSTRWTRIDTTRTDSRDGIFSFTTHKPSRNTDYRVRFAGDLVYSPSEDTARVNVRRALTGTLIRAGDTTYTLRGAVAPKYAGKIIRLHRKTCASCAWKTVKYSTTTTSSSYAFQLSAPTTRGTTWYYRVYIPADAHFLASYLSGVRISTR